MFCNGDVIFKEHKFTFKQALTSETPIVQPNRPFPTPLYTNDDDFEPASNIPPTVPNIPEPNVETQNLSKQPIPESTSADHNGGIHAPATNNGNVPLIGSQRNTTTPIWLKDFFYPDTLLLLSQNIKNHHYTHCLKKMISSTYLHLMLLL